MLIDDLVQCKKCGQTSRTFDLILDLELSLPQLSSREEAKQKRLKKTKQGGNKLVETIAEGETTRKLEV